MKELISVIVPVYKVGAYLNKCVDSVLGQSYGNFELILIDDGSPDRCGEICDEYAARDSRVRVIHKENGGLSAARNSGIEIARGDYLTFLDSDDWIHGLYLERLRDLLFTASADIAAGNFICTAGEDREVGLTNPKVEVFSNLEALEQLTGRLYVQMVIACAKLYKRDLFTGIRFPPGKFHEDEFTTHKLLYKAAKIVVTSEQLLYYRQREDSIMGGKLNIKKRSHVAQAFRERAEFFNEIGLKEAGDKTYKNTFYFYKEVLENKEDFKSLGNRAEVLEQFRSLRPVLRKGRHNFKFKVGYELYYLVPGLMNIVYKFYDRVSRRKC
jgi:glycosyltransferase involved in cell wall biosynthesis